MTNTEKYLVSEVSVIKTLRTAKTLKNIYKVFNPVIDIIYDITVLKNDNSLSDHDKRQQIKKSSIDLYNLSKQSKLDPLYVDMIKAMAIIINKHA